MNESIATLGHVATPAEAMAVMESPQADANSVLQSERQKMGSDVLYSGTIEEISLAMASDIGGGDLGAEDKARIPKQVRNFLNDHFQNPNSEKPIQVTKQDLSAISNELSEYGSRAMDKPSFARTANFITAASQPDAARPAPKAKSALAL